MKYKVTHDGHTKTYVVLKHTAWHLLESAKDRTEGSLLNLQAAAVFNAFAFEAYLNHVGSEEINFWDEIERISYAKKLRVIDKHLKLNIDYGSPPFQVIKELFALRNTLAHGRTTPINSSYETDIEPSPMSSWRIHDWETLTIDKVSLYADCVRSAVERINAARMQPDHEFELWNQGGRGRTVELQQ